MNTNTKLACALGAFVFLLAGMLIAPANGESPVSVTPFEWHTGMEP